MIGNFDKCCACRTCEQLCPTHAIKMKYNSEGFLYPHIDKSKCIGCKLCENRCDFNNDLNLFSVPKKGYAATAKNSAVLNSSTSDGAFVSICNAINPDAIIYGCAFQNGLNVCQTRVEGIQNINIFQKSKYVQSDTKDTFRLAEQDLKNHKTVIYSGTPCQIAGLKAYLGKEYDNLYTIGLICHGVPSQKLFDRYIDYLQEKHRIKITKYSFRERNELLGDIQLGISFGNDKKEIRRGWNQDYFMNLFLTGKCYRNDCYTCKYANKDARRPEDFTIGDCWKIEETIQELDAAKGVSTILFNTQRAIDTIDRLHKYMNLYEVETQILIKNNPNLIMPTKLNPVRNEIYKALSEEIPFKKFAPMFVKRLGYPHMLRAIYKKFKRYFPYQRGVQ